MPDHRTRSRRAPPAIVLGSAALAAVALWLVVRLAVAAVLAIGLRAPTFSVPALLPLRFSVTLIVCTVVAALALIDAARSHESVFQANLGLGRRGVAALAAGCAVLLELVLAVLLRAATGA